MINVTTHRLGNGLIVLHHYNAATRMAALNLLYKVGSADEQPQHTGLAHLLEHLMFTGSKGAPSFDGPLQAAGGVSNAWTNVDVTNFYDIVPAHNIDTAMWLERDRLLNLNLNDDSIALQKSVVIEEFKQRYLNRPYGDILHLLDGLAYKVHPYRWPTIGLSTDDIADMPKDAITDFHKHYYSVNNLILCIAGNINVDRAVALAERYFGDIEPAEPAISDRPAEPEQTEPRQLVRHSDTVPANLIIRAYHMCDRLSPDFPAADLLSDILSNGPSSRFMRGALMKSGMFSELEASVAGVDDPGLFFVRAYLTDGTPIERAQQAIDDELKRLLDDGPTPDEVTKYANKFISTQTFENIGYHTKAARLCKFEQRSAAEDINREPLLYRAVTADDITRVARQILRPTNCSSILYLKD